MRERCIDNYLGDFTIEDLQERVEHVARKYPRIIGVLAIGSLVQTQTPADFYIPQHTGLAGAAYEKIRRPLRRKDGSNPNSDLDIWVCTEDTTASEKAKHQVDKGGAALVEELASGTLQKGTQHWRNKKVQAFGQYYKRLELYHNEFNTQDPWMSSDFKADLETEILKSMPGFANNINSHFRKQIPGDFIEIRAFPESLFNLRPDEAILPDGSEDRAPFPRVADKQWISTAHNANILFNTDRISIYPFREKGEVLGSYIGTHIDNLAIMEKQRTSYGGIMLKPDALKAEDLSIIRQKIQDKITENGGRIIIDRTIDILTDEDIDQIYPLLDRSDISDVKKYLQSGPVEIFIVEMPLDPYETFRVVNSIKGPRVGDRSDGRLEEGRILNGAVRDLLPLPGDEAKYRQLIPTILKKRQDPNTRFTRDQYDYYAKNLMHTPDNSVDLKGLQDAVSASEATADEQ